MKQLYFLFAIFFLVGCSHTLEEMDFTGPSNGLKVEAEQGKFTRNGFDKKGNFYWSEKDRIGVNTDIVPTTFSALQLFEGAGTSKALFKGAITGQMGNYAIYPMADDHALNGLILTYTLSASYTYSTVDADFFSTPQGKGNSFNAPMWGKISDGKVQMKHLGGVICVKVNKLPVGDDLTFSFSSKQKINGNFTTNLEEPIPSLTTYSHENEKETTLKITFSNSNNSTSGVFYIPAPTGTYENARVKILNDAEELYNTALGTIVITRCDLKAIEVTMGEIQINETNFPDAIFRKDVRGYDKDNNGSLSQEERDAIYTIFVHNKGIYTLKGIEYFQNISQLHCASNQLTTLDLSKNSDLEKIDCKNNQLTNLNVSNCSKLRDIDCTNNQLTTLDVSHAPSLVSLQCTNNQLTDLNLDQNPRLEKLYCSDNQLKTLDASLNTNLKQLKCTNNQLTTLDISANKSILILDIRMNNLLKTLYVWLDFDWNNLIDSTTGKDANTEVVVKCEIPDTKFKDYLLNNFDKNKSGELSQEETNAVKEINVKFVGINDLKGIELFKNLQSLTCNQNQLTSLVLNNNTELTFLSCGNNQLKTLDITNCTKLSNISCPSNQLTTLDTSHNLELETLYCNKNQLENLDLNKNTKLKIFHCYENQLTTLNVNQNTLLTDFRCNTNQLQTLDISNNTLLELLDCSLNKISELDIYNNRKITYLDIQMNGYLKELYIWYEFIQIKDNIYFFKDSETIFKVR